MNHDEPAAGIWRTNSQQIRDTEKNGLWLVEVNVLGVLLVYKVCRYDHKNRSMLEHYIEKVPIPWSQVNRYARITP